MIKKTFFLFILLGLYVKAQPNQYDKYLENMAKASKFENNNHFKDALRCYESNLKIVKKNPKIGDLGSLYSNKAAILFKQNKIKKGISTVKKAIINGASIEVLDYKYLFTDSISKLLHKNILPEYENLIRKKFSKMKNLEVYVEVEKLIAEDQIFRENKDILKTNNIIKTDDDYWRALEIIDSINSKKLIALIKKHGHTQSMWLIIWHNRDTYKQNTKFWNFIIPYINNEIKKGDLPHSFFADFEDNKSIDETGYSIYGTIPGKVNPDTVNIKRAEVFLLPLTKERIEFINSQW